MNLQDALADGIRALGLDLPEGTPERLEAFARLLIKWNKVYNLTAIRDENQVLTHHLLDSLSVLPALAGITRLVDVGSGGGLPGVVLAIARPDLQVDSVETVQKKATFRQQAAIQLGLKNVMAHHARVETMTGQYAQISSRAFAEIGLFISLTRHLLAPGGRWLAMKGVRPDDEIAALPADIVVDQIIPLHVPGLDAERHLIILKAGQ